MLNAVLGDWLRARGNGLEIAMGLRHGGGELACDAAGLGRAHAAPTGKVAVFVHGLGNSEAVWSFPGEPGTSYGALLERDLGIAPLYVRYNSGLAVEENGAELARLLDRLASAYPVPLRELTLVGFSMGGLVVRSACAAAARDGRAWLRAARRAVYVGAPHEGVPLEALGVAAAWALRKVPSAHTRLVADVLDLRSAGVKDLGAGAGAPLVPGVEHHFVAGTLGKTEAHLASRLLGDALVRVASAAPAAREEGAPRTSARVFPGVHHVGLAHHPAVYEALRAWCAEGEAGP